MGMWSTLGSWFSRTFAPSMLGSGWAGRGGSVEVIQDYDTARSMSALAKFPWVRTCVRAVASDLAGLPLVAVRPGIKRKRELVDHEVLTRLEAPAWGMTGRRFRRQIIADFMLSGNAFIWDRRPVGGGIYRMNPAQVRPMFDASTGLVTGWHYGLIRQIPAEDVVHIADLSWGVGSGEVLGESPIRAAHEELLAELYARQQAARSAKRGRMEFLFSPAQDNVSISQEQVDELLTRWDKDSQSGRGAFWVGRAAKAQQLTLTAKDMEFNELRATNRSTVLALFGVPPTRVGLPGANYGTARQEARGYWESLVGLVTLVDDGLTQLVRDGSGVRIEHDFTAVEALQASYTERQARVVTWVQALGADPAKAAEYEGFDEAPVGEPGAGAAPVLPDADEPRRNAVWAIQGYLAGAAARAADVELDVHVERSVAGAMLAGAGHSGAAARQLAEDLADDVVETVHQARMHQPDAALVDLPLFGVGRAMRLARRLEAA